MNSTFQPTTFRIDTIQLEKHLMLQKHSEIMHLLNALNHVNRLKKHLFEFCLVQQVKRQRRTGPAERCLLLTCAERAAWETEEEHTSQLRLHLDEKMRKGGKQKGGLPQ